MTTEDGYILHVFNIYKEGLAADAPVIFLQHGIMCCSDYWTNQQESSPAIILAKAGYNVFLGNNRGNRYGRRHETLDPIKDRKKFSNYSWYEMGKYDLVAMIDFVLK